MNTTQATQCIGTDLSVIIPAKDEAESLPTVLKHLAKYVPAAEIFVICDSPHDSTLQVFTPSNQQKYSQVHALINHSGGVPAALKLGIATANRPYIAIVMADGSDDVSVLPKALSLLQADQADIVVPSRYAPGGGAVGVPWLKGLLSRWASLSLHIIFGFPSSDATNAFFITRRLLLAEQLFKSRKGFTLAFEAKLRLWQRQARFQDIAVVWQERRQGQSKFKLWSWLPAYLRWYFVAIDQAIRRRWVL